LSILSEIIFFDSLKALKQPIKNINQKPISIIAILFKEARSLFSLLYSKIPLEQDPSVCTYVNIETLQLNIKPSLIKFSILAKPIKKKSESMDSIPQAKLSLSSSSSS